MLLLYRNGYCTIPETASKNSRMLEWNSNPPRTRALSILRVFVFPSIARRLSILSFSLAISIWAAVKNKGVREKVCLGRRGTCGPNILDWRGSTTQKIVWILAIPFELYNSIRCVSMPIWWDIFHRAQASQSGCPRNDTARQATARQTTNREHNYPKTWTKTETRRDKQRWIRYQNVPHLG